MDNSNNRNNLPTRNPLIAFLVVSLVVTVLLNLLISALTTPRREEISYTQFMAMLENDELAQVELSNDQINMVKKSAGSSKTASTPSPQAGVNMFDFSSKQTQDRTVYYTGYIDDPELLPKLREHGVEFTHPVPYKMNPILEFLLTWILPVIVMVGLLWLLTRSMTKRMGGSGGMMGFGKSNAKVYVQTKTGVSFADVAGQEEAKESLDEIVDFLHHPQKYTAIGAKQPKGALLVGPPGTGKTLLAKAVAGEANVPFFSISGSEFVEMFVGMGASRVRDLFKQASEKAPCIIFIDEIDAIGKSRDNQFSSNDEREQTLNQLLSEMDGFDSTKAVVILAATNRPEVLDKALLRPGRFDRRIIVEKPDLKGREDILKVHAKNVKMDSAVDLHEIALATSGAAGADLANMINEAALRAVRMGRTQVAQEDLMEAVEVVIAGKEKKDRILSEKEKKIVAFHEVGHALASALQKNTQPVQKITIVPRTKGSLGYTMQMPEEEHYLMSKDEIIDQITVLVAGRAAEELIFHTQTTGASNDIERATQMARSMISMYGMSEEFGMTALESVQNQYLDGRAAANCSEETKTRLDNAVIRLMDSCYRKANALLRENESRLRRISEFLIEKETITGDEFMEIFNRDEIAQNNVENADAENNENNEAE